MISDLYNETADVQCCERTRDAYGSWVTAWSNLVADIPCHIFLLSGSEIERYKKLEVDVNWALLCAPPAPANIWIKREYGDALNQFSAWTFVGWAKGTNTDVKNRVHVSIADVAGTRTVSIYSDAARTVLVAEGARAGDGAVNLIAQAGSGLSGTVEIVFSADVADIYMQGYDCYTEQDRVVFDGRDFDIKLVLDSPPNHSYIKLLLSERK